MNIWRRCISQNQTPGPAPTPIPPWDNSKLIFEKYPSFSRKVVNNQDVSNNGLDRYFTDLTPTASFTPLYEAYGSSGNRLNHRVSKPGISRVYPFKASVGGEFNYNEDYDNHSTQYTSGNTVAYYCIYWATNVRGISYLALMDALSKNGFYRNIPGNIPIQPAVEMPVTYFKNGIYRATKELVTPGTPIPTENTLINGFKIGNTTTLYSLQGPSVIQNGRAKYPMPQTSQGARPWSHTTMNNRYFTETGGSSDTIPAYVTCNNVRYNTADFMGLTIPFAPVDTVYVSFSGTSNYTMYGIIIASSNFNIQDQTIDF